MTAVRGKRALITGAGHGLGKEIARRFARAGAEVVVTDRDAQRVSDTVRLLGLEGGRAIGYPLDVTDADQVRSVRARLNMEHGPIDVLVNNAGVVAGGAFLDVPPERHRATVAVNLLGLMTVTHAFLPDLLPKLEAHVVNLVSASAIVPLPCAASYAASKWGALGFTESLREELRVLDHRHVRVTAVCPSFTATGLFEGARPPRLTWLLSPEVVADAVLRAVERNREFVLFPWTVRLLDAVCGVMPRPAYRRVCAWLGVSTSMLDWKGHPTSG